MNLYLNKRSNACQLIFDKDLPSKGLLKLVSISLCPSFFYYWKSGLPMENDTTYRLSYWECPSIVNDPIRPVNSLTTGDGDISDETTYKNSYLGNWCHKPEPSITPCQKQWLGRGPMQSVTSQKHDYTWKCVKPPEPIKAQQNLYCPPARLSDDTTYKLSYYESACHLPVTSYGHIRKYVKPDVPMEDCTTYKLSYWPNENILREDQPCYTKREYTPPVEPMDSCTTYNLSYWPCSEKRRSPIVLQENENLLNADCCSDNNTTYRLSYFGCGGDKRDPIRQPGNILFSPCPAAHDTIYRMSFLGNWCVKQEPSITPCSRQWLGRGPIQDVTTQKHDYTWKLTALDPSIRPEDNLVCVNLPMECCTTHRLSYWANDHNLLTPTLNYTPIRSYKAPDIPMKTETTMQLSYQPVEVPSPDRNVSTEKSYYYPPTTKMEDSTTYNRRYFIILHLKSNQRHKPIKYTGCP
ncbi:uncharacterized protein LOC143184827 [Calliopsis andreniformis]|uniref:uncharacterized protein LOC143184827 n=1 Tax=Calliopsis andreniformis TaxID=337506 RepID=UPI003FCE3DE9